MVLAIILLIVSFSAYASMAVLQFRFYQSIFPDTHYWNPLRSWNNKYKNGNKSEGEAFIGSTTIFVWITDGYHLMQFIFENCLFLAMSVCNSNFAFYWWFIGIRVIYGTVFNLFFDRILIIKK